MFCVHQLNKYSNDREYFDTYDEAHNRQIYLAQIGRASSMYWVDPEEVAEEDLKNMAAEEFCSWVNSVEKETECE